MQSTPHEMPGCLEVTTPLPVPAFSTVTRKSWSAKFAVTETAVFIVTTHIPVPEQAVPVQPVNTESASGAAVKVTTVPGG
jgi:hypothetical protein